MGSAIRPLKVKIRATGIFSKSKMLHAGDLSKGRLGNLESGILWGSLEGKQLVYILRHAF